MKHIFREFIIMFRKMTFIFINTLPMIGNFQKSLVILMISAVSYLINFKHKPFAWESLNKMEEKSNLSAFLTIFGGCLYVSKISDSLKIIVFSTILMANSLFLLKWISTVINIYARLYAPKLFKICPKFMRFLLKFHVTIQTFARAFSSKKQIIFPKRESNIDKT